MFYWVKTPNIIQKLFSNRIWTVPTDEKILFLTFDDGPTPEVTDWVLELLEKYQAKATFFCIGKNIAAHPEIFQNIVKASHVVANHTFSHEKSWRTTTSDYLKSVERTTLLLENQSNKQVNLFRPPYGRIRPKHVRDLNKKEYKVVMWDLLSGDFDKELNTSKALKNLIKHTKKGSVIVFHDSKKAFENLKKLLPQYLEYWSNKGYVFKSLN